MANRKQYFLRNLISEPTETIFVKRPEFTPEQEAIVEEHLKYLDQIKVMVSASIVTRLVHSMREATKREIDPVYLMRRIAGRLGYATASQMNKNKGTKDRILTRLKHKQMLHDKARLEALERGTLSVTDFTTFFFYTDTLYLLTVEHCLSVYTDVHLDEAYRTGQKLSFDQWYSSFGMFFLTVLKDPALEGTPVGRGVLRRLARMVFTWHHRELIPASTLIRTIRHLPRKYRAITFNDRQNGVIPEHYLFDDVPFDEEDSEEKIASSWHQ